MSKLLATLLNLIVRLIEIGAKVRAKRDHERRQTARRMAEADPAAWFNDHFRGDRAEELHGLHTDANHQPQLPRLPPNQTNSDNN